VPSEPESGCGIEASYWQFEAKNRGRNRVGTNVVMVGHVGVGSHCSMLTSYSLRRVSDLLVRAKDLFAVAQG
jgi:hypothetical protein